MTVEDWIQTVVGLISGLLLAIAFLAIQGIIFALTNHLVTSEFFVMRLLAWAIDLANGLLFLLVFFVIFSSLRKNHKLAMRITNTVLLMACIVYLGWWIFW